MKFYDEPNTNLKNMVRRILIPRIESRLPNKKLAVKFINEVWDKEDLRIIDLYLKKRNLKQLVKNGNKR